ncbi:MAG: cytochrome c-type biogenesis protein [Pseudomonadota bacterium]
MIKALLFSVILALQGTAPLENPEDEARAQDLMREIRCVACENEPVSQSAADIAGDMRVRIRTMVAEGKSDEEVRAWFVERYGEFVLFRPGSDGLTGKLLWGLPFIVLLMGAAVLFLRRDTETKPEIEPVDAQDA